MVQLCLVRLDAHRAWRAAETSCGILLALTVRVCSSSHAPFLSCIFPSASRNMRGSSMMAFLFLAAGKIKRKIKRKISCQGMMDGGQIRQTSTRGAAAACLQSGCTASSSAWPVSRARVWPGLVCLPLHTLPGLGFSAANILASTISSPARVWIRHRVLLDLA